MDAVKRHYESLLGLHYSWLMGGFEENAARSEALIDDLGIAPRLSGKAVDFGCGSGFQVIPLARRGFRVTGVDSCRQLLDEMKQRAGGLPVTVVEQDMLDFARRMPEQVELAVCMGDTLAHLADRKEVQGFLGLLHQGVEPGGRLLLTFRDQTCELNGPDRFFVPRADESRIFTCFLEYGEEHLDVTDLLHLRGDEGWTLGKSQYRKVRLTAELVSGYCLDAGFSVLENRTERGLVTLFVEKQHG